MSGKRTAVSSLDGVTSSSPGELGTPAPALVARTVEIDPARVEDLLALLPTDDPVSWVRRDEGLVGWGCAAQVRTEGSTRFSDAAKWWEETTARSVVRDEVEEPGTGMVCFGTFAFADEPGDSVLQVPSVVVGRRGDRAWMTVVGRGSLEALEPRLSPAVAPDAPAGITFADGALNSEEWMSAVADQ